MSDILNHILRLAETEPVEAAIMLVQGTTQPDPADPLKLPWSVESALIAAKRFIPSLTPDDIERVRAAVAVNA